MKPDGGPKNLLLTGRPGVGKTTLLERVVKGLNVPAGGFYTREIREGGARVGFCLTTWKGERGVLAHLKMQSPDRVGRYGVDREVMERIGVAAVWDAIGESALIAIDELGRMELCSPAFAEAVWAALDSPKPLVAVIQDRPHPFLDRVRGRPDVQLLRVGPDNRDSLVTECTERLRTRVQSVLERRGAAK